VRRELDIVINSVFLLATSFKVWLIFTLIELFKMRYLLYYILLISISCKEKTDINGLGYFSNVKISIDTVIINPGNEIIYLKNDLFSADVSMNTKYLFNFNLNDHALEKINLDELRLEKKIFFEKEGPNGTGSFIGKIKIYEENQLLLNNMGESTLFSLDGKKLKRIFFESFLIGGHPMKGGEQVRPTREFDKESNRLYGLVYYALKKRLDFGIFDLTDFEIHRIELNTFDRIINYSFTNLTGNAIITLLPEMEVEKFGTNVIISNQITSSLMWYNTEMDSLFFKSYNSQLTANEKVEDYQLQHETDKSFDSEYSRFHQEINFLPPFWDEKNQIFYRFSYQEIPSENKDEVKSKVYLTVFDVELNQIGEIFLSQLNKKPSKHFAKDGKLWIYENINDDLAFVVLTISK
jgi:hypothetical protein